MDMKDFSEKIADFTKWGELVDDKEIERILEYQRECLNEQKDFMVLRFLFENISSTVMYPYYVWVVFHIDNEEMTSISIHLPAKSSSWLEMPIELQDKAFLPIDSVAFAM